MTRVIAAGCVLALCFIGCEQFPTDRAVEAKFKQIHSGSVSDREAALTGLLQSISNPQNKTDDHAVDYLMGQLVATYNASHAEWVLDSVDHVHLDGGFANSVCGLYAKLFEDASFRRRYSSPSHRKALGRCVGLSISREQYESLAHEPTRR